MAVQRLPALIVAVAALLAGAILWDVAGALTHRGHASARETAARAAESATATAQAAPSSPTAASVPASANPTPASAPVPELSYIEQLARSDTRRRLRASVEFTYLNEVVAESADSALHRWDGRSVTPVQVYLAGGSVANFQPAFVDEVRRAFQRWADAGVPVRFALDADSDHAEVRFIWKTQFDIERTGQTDLAWDPDGRIQRAEVTIATFDPRGHPLSSGDIWVVALHEIGHLIGLDHSSDSTDIMFPKTLVRDLSPRDERSAQLLYELPPGSLR